MGKTNIVLIGMPASGKSTIGVILAKVLGMDFMDTDLLIQKQTGKRLAVLIEELGEQGFIALEEQILSQIDTENTIISTGGSAVYGMAAMEHFKTDSCIVYLEVSFAELEKRLSDIKGRGVVLKAGQTLEDLYLERIPLYEKYADRIFDESGKTVEDMVSAIASAVS